MSDADPEETESFNNNENETTSMLCVHSLYTDFTSAQIHGLFSAGLVIGGKNLKEEGARMARMNILIATPGRLLQHFDQTYGFTADGLQMLSESHNRFVLYLSG